LPWSGSEDPPKARIRRQCPMQPLACRAQAARREDARRARQDPQARRRGPRAVSLAAEQRRRGLGCRGGDPGRKPGAGGADVGCCCSRPSGRAPSWRPMSRPARASSNSPAMARKRSRHESHAAGGVRRRARQAALWADQPARPSRGRAGQRPSCSSKGNRPAQGRGCSAVPACSASSPSAH